MAPIAPPRTTTGTKPTGKKSSSSSTTTTTTNKRPTARQKAQARLLDPLLPRKLHRQDNVVSDSFINSKRDKQVIKHSAFVSRISSSSSSAPSSGGVRKSSSKQKITRRRRPSKKLVATLESLGDALADIQTEIRQEDADKPEEGKIRHKSLKSRPGALKKKEKVIKGEMERFGRNLAQLAAVTEGVPPTDETGGADRGQTTTMEVEENTDGKAQMGQSAATSNRWAALRGFISSTMEQNPAFLNKT